MLATTKGLRILLGCLLLLACFRIGQLPLIISILQNPNMETKPTRSVHFAATSQIFLIPNDDMVHVYSRWNSAEDEARFQRETVQHARHIIQSNCLIQLRRTLLGSNASPPRDFSEEDFINNCTGIELIVLFSRSTMRRLEQMNRAHIDGVLNAQHVLNPTDLSCVSRMSSHHARQRASVVANWQTWSGE